MNNTLLVIAANTAVTACYVSVISAVSTVLDSIVYIALAGGLHIALCCIAGVVFYSRGDRAFARGFFISAALLLAAPIVLMQF